MSNLKQINDVAPTPNSRVVDPTTGLTAKQEAFCLAFLEENNAACAYRRAYDIGASTQPSTVWKNASELMANVLVIGRIRFLKEEAAKTTICVAADLLREWYDVATADPTELVKISRYNCRNCTGDNFGYHWKDVAEFEEACIKAAMMKKPVLPMMDGGFGWNGRGVPNPICPHCYGEGVEHSYVADTDKISTKARKLIKSITHNRHGEIVIETKDQQKALESLARCFGMFNDKLIIPKTPGAGENKVIGEGVSPQDAQRMFQDMLNG